MSNKCNRKLSKQKNCHSVDEGSFVEIGGAVTARNTDSTCRKKKLRLTGSLPAME